MSGAAGRSSMTRTSWESAQQILTDAELSDGLPLVPPTRRRLEAMVAGVAGRSDSHGLMPPMFGDITPDSVAYQCVIAGCRPAELPVVLAAAEAILEPDFNLLGIATTTGTACVALCVHGADRAPARRQCRHQLPGPRQPRQCQHRPRAAAQPPQHRRRALRCRRHGDHGPARQIHAVLRRAQRRPLPHPHRAPRPRRRCERDHGDGHLRHRRSAARRRRGRHARGHPRRRSRRRCGPPSSCRA